MKNLILAFATMLAIAPVSFAHATTPAVPNDIIGTILAVEGSATIKPFNAPAHSPAGLNTPVRAGDVLTTGESSRLFVQMIDNTELTLGEGAVMRVDQYAYHVKDSSRNGAVYSIAQGNFLFVDGLLGDTPNPNIQVNTPVGAITIRGTRFWGGTIDGTYGVLVGDGTVTLSNKAGTVTLNEGEATILATANDTPAPAQKWDADKIKRASDTVALKDIGEIGKRMQENAKRNETLLREHDTALKLNEQRDSRAKGATDLIEDPRGKIALPDVLGSGHDATPGVAGSRIVGTTPLTTDANTGAVQAVKNKIIERLNTKSAPVGDMDAPAGPVQDIVKDKAE